MSYIIAAGARADAERVGGKAAALSALYRAGLPVPLWFTIASDAFAASLTPAQERACATQEGAALQAALADVRPSARVRRDVERALAALCPRGERVAVRSSACQEDGPRHSFAGQLDSFLFVAPQDVLDRVADVWRSAASAHLLTYRRARGLSARPRFPAVLIQRMVDADVAGVAFSADPVSGCRDTAVVSAVYGLGAALVSGACDADTYHVDLQGRVVARAIAEKRHAQRLDTAGGGGTRMAPVAAEQSGQAALRDDEVRAVAELAWRCAHERGVPQDVEWAIAGGRLFLLQARPITALPAGTSTPPAGITTLWDNSNIAESYSGVTTPLTFSFACHAYEAVYRELCRVMRVPEDVIAAHDDTFRCMLGLIQGRVYYNLLNWYRLLALLPGFTVNRAFMEGMMGVEDGLPREIAAGLDRARWQHRLGDGLRLLATAGGLVANYLTLPRRVRRFYARIDQALTPCPDLQGMRADALAASYHALERRLLTRWDAPVLNDLYAMIFYGLLRRLTTAWCGSGMDTLHHELLCGEGGMISAEPAARVRALAAIAARHPDFVATLCTGSEEAILRASARIPPFEAALRDYLDRFADRCLEDLKLESATLRDDPLPLLRSVGALARRMLETSGERPASPAGQDAAVRQQAERRVRAALAGHPLRRMLFQWVLGEARARLRDRENLRFERTRVFGRVRRIFLAMGHALCDLDALAEPRDVFYLDLDEVLGFVDGTATCTDLKALVAVRKAEFARFRAAPPPPDRFETRSVAHRDVARPRARAGSAADDGGERRHGLGCYPGRVRGPVRLVADPTKGGVQPGEILVAEQTDPGWVMLFPQASGVLVERGSVLSHSAIIARELGLPTIVALRGLTHWLADGDWVEIDGRTGTVTRLPSPDQ